MAIIGLLNKITGLNLGNWNAHKEVENSEEQQLLDASRRQTLVAVKEVASSKDIYTILETERIILVQDLEYHGNSQEEISSIQTALHQYAEAQDSLETVKDGLAYQAGTKTYSSRHREGGLPIDSMREFLKSHTTRLSNRLAAPLSVSEKNILRQRKENLKVAKELYIGMQREALGQAKSNGKGLER